MHTPLPRESLTSILRELCTTVALCYFITLALLRLITAHLDLPAMVCTGSASESQLLESEYRGALQRALGRITNLEVLTVTTAFSLLTFGTLELCLLLARRAGYHRWHSGSDAEGAIQLVSEKQLEK